jgi:hypothetical protein
MADVERHDRSVESRRGDDDEHVGQVVARLDLAAHAHVPREEAASTRPVGVGRRKHSAYSLHDGYKTRDHQGVV